MNSEMMLSKTFPLSILSPPQVKFDIIHRLVNKKSQLSVHDYKNTIIISKYDTLNTKISQTKSSKLLVIWFLVAKIGLHLVVCVIPTN